MLPIIVIVCFQLFTNGGHGFSQSSLSVGYSLKYAKDIFLLIDESPESFNKDYTVIRNLIPGFLDYVQSSQPKVQFMIGFYGASNQTRWVIQDLTADVNTIKTKLQSMRYVPVPQTADRLPQSLEQVHETCLNRCQSNANQILTILTHSFDSLWENNLRPLKTKFSMNVIMLGIGQNIDVNDLYQLVTSPADEYADVFENMREVFLLNFLNSITDNIPPILASSSKFEIFNFTQGDYLTLQVDVEEATKHTETLIAFILSCLDCRVFGSISKSQPTLSNADQAFGIRSAPGTPAYSYIYHFRIPKDTQRLYLGIRPSLSQSSVKGFINTFNPQVLTESRV